MASHVKLDVERHPSNRWMGRLKPAQQRHIQDSPVNQSQFADSENEHPPSQFGHREQQGLRAVEPETKEIHSQMESSLVFYI